MGDSHSASEPVRFSKRVFEIILLLPSCKEILHDRLGCYLLSQLFHIAGLAAVKNCPRRHDRRKPWDMARPEQVLVLEPQHELKFRGNAVAEVWAGNKVAT